jgi:hypothetical protein
MDEASPEELRKYSSAGTIKTTSQYPSTCAVMRCQIAIGFRAGTRSGKRPRPLRSCASATRCAAGRLARKTAEDVTAAMSGIPSIQEECALSAFTNGLRLSASHVSSGRFILIGMRSDLLIFGTHRDSGI